MKDDKTPAYAFAYPMRPCCAYCGSFNVVQDAWASWIEAEHCWTLQQVFDEGECLDCGDNEIAWTEKE